MCQLYIVSFKTLGGCSLVHSIFISQLREFGTMINFDPELILGLGHCDDCVLGQEKCLVS